MTGDQSLDEFGRTRRSAAAADAELLQSHMSRDREAGLG